MDEDPAARFAELVAGPPESLRLDLACVLLAHHADPDLTSLDTLPALDELAAGVAPTAEAVRARLFDEAGFAGDVAAYHDPRNSLLPAVVERRRGIPLSLAVVTIEVGRRCGLRLEGVGMPGHFLVREADQPDRFLDVFDGGRELDRTGCRAIFDRLVAGTPWDDHYLDPVGPHAMVARTLANLANAYRRAGDRTGLCRALRLRVLLPGVTDRERRELAVLLSASGRFDEAASALEEAGQPSDLDAATRMRARLN